MTNLFRVSGGGLPAGLQTDMDAVLNKKFSTSTTYPPLTWPSNVNLLGPLPERTASGSIASFTDGANNVPIADGVFDIDYDANGYSALRIGKSAKNLCGGDALLQNAKFYLPAGTADDVNRTFTFLATNTVAPTMGGFSGSLNTQFKENTSYTFIMTYTNTQSRSNMRIYYTDDTYDNLPNGTTTKQTYVIVSNPNKTVARLVKFTSNGSTTLYVDECGTFEGTLTAQDFEAWSGIERKIYFPHGKNILPSNDIDWSSGYKNDSGVWTSSNNAHYTQMLPIKSNTQYTISGTLSNSTSYRLYFLTELGEWISRTATQTTDYTFTTPSNCSFYQIQCGNDIDLLDVQLEEGSTATTYEPFTYIYGGYYDSVTGVLVSTKAADGTDLADPDEYQLDPVELLTAYLDNNFWCDTGDSSITYRADIDALITELGG